MTRQAKRPKAAEEPKRPSNYYHLALEAAGAKVVEDFMAGFAHGYIFDCGCARVYSVSPVSFGDSESLTPCSAHKTLLA